MFEGLGLISPKRATNLILFNHKNQPRIHLALGLEAPGPLPQKRKKPKSKKTPTETKVTPSKPTKDSEQSHSVSSGTVPDPQDPVRNIQLDGTGLPSTLDEGTRKSQTLSEGKKSDPKDSVGNIQPIDMGLPSTVFDEGAAKTTLLSEGPRIDAKYQADQTQSARLRYRSLTKNKGKTSYEAESDTQTLQLNTFADVQPFLLFEDEMAQESDDDVLEAKEDMEEDTQTDEEEHQSPPPNTDKPEPSLAQDTQESDYDSSSPELKKYDNILPHTERQLVKYLRKVSQVLFNRLTEEQWEKHKEVAVSYADLRASIEGCNEENVDHKEQTDKLVQATMDHLDKHSTDRAKLLKALNEADTEKPHYHTEGEHVAMDDDTKKPKSDKAKEEPTQLSSPLKLNQSLQS
ncbi:hypothetical protein Tco_1056731 [Tanacetum coccineum]|uniref:Uncharacterized protein n=1 Tax=Tanacetum coccineum TaxID=301880 RepID=A0ABQ5H3J9_9ASTR